MDFKNFHYRGIRFKITIVVIVIFSAITLSANYIIYHQVKTTLNDADNRERMTEAQQLIDKMGGDPAVIPLPDSEAYLKITLRNPVEETEIFASTDFPNMQFEDALSEITELEGFKVATAFQPLNDGNNRVITLSVARSNADLLAQLNQIRQYLLLANLIAMFISAILSLIITSLFLKPIKKIIETSRSIKASKNMERLEEPKTNDEIQQLAQTINNMLQRIEDDINNQTNFFNSASHELRTPLTVMQTELSLALQKTQNPEHKELLESQLLEVGRLTRIIKDLLIIGQLKGNVLRVNKTVASFDEIIYSALKKIQLLITHENKGVKLNIAEENTDLIIHCDVDKIENVFINIFENAIKYSVPSSILEINLNKSDDEFKLSITNMVEQEVPDIELLTSEYHRNDHRTSGMGLGLWICKNIAQLHNGDITISQHEKQFTVTLTLPGGAF